VNGVTYWIVDPAYREKFNDGIAVNKIVQPPSAESERRGRLRAHERLLNVVNNTRNHQVHHTVGQHLCVHTEVLRGCAGAGA